MDEALHWIGILDVFGFESFQTNSFEQFCINFCNERLQQFFNFFIIRSEQDEYLREAIFWTPLKVPDSQDLIDLVTSRGQPPGIIALLDSACNTPGSTPDKFVQSVLDTHKANSRVQRIGGLRKAGAGVFAASSAASSMPA